jgi:diguanylate cyclase (GGDEF)-like protein
LIRGGAAAVLTSEQVPKENDRIAFLSRERRPLRAATIALLVLACLASALVLTWSMLHARRLELSNAAIATSNNARTLAEQANSSFKMADTVLVSLVDDVEVGGLSSTNVDRIRQLMTKHILQLPALQGLFIYDADGRWMVTSAGSHHDGRNNSDRAYFQYHRTHPSREVHIGRPIVGRTSGVWVIPVSRRIERPDGSFAGVALATIKVDFFRKIYESLDIGDDGRILMMLNEGALLLRVPFDPAGIGSDVTPHPIFRLQAQKNFPNRGGEIDVEGQARTYAYSRVGDYPVGIVVSRSRAEVLRPWMHTAGVAYLALVVLVGGLLVLGRRVFRQVVLRDHLQRELMETKEELEAANASLSTMAYIDGLTDLFNRRYYEKVFDRELRRACRNGSSVAVLIIDVDHFKKFNDRYGHPMGDECLKKVARAILAGMRRSGDMAARYGGEEFVVVLPDTDLAGARMVAETIRAHVASLVIEHADAAGGVVTVSIGAHAGVPSAGDGSGPAFIAAADAALYRAKTAGRNRVAA